MEKLEKCIASLLILTVFGFNSFSQTHSNQIPYTFDMGMGLGRSFVLTQNPKFNFALETYTLSLAQRFNRRGIFRLNGEYCSTSEIFNKLYSVGSHIGYASQIKRRFSLAGPYTSLPQFLLDVIIGLLPRNMEFTIGASFGYIENPRPVFTENSSYYRITENSSFALESGIRLNLMLWRIKLSGGAILAYNLSQNYEYTDYQGVYYPRLFLKPSLSLNFAF